MTDFSYEDRRLLAVTQVEMVEDVCGFYDEDDLIDAAEAWAAGDDDRLALDLLDMAEGTL